MNKEGVPEPVLLTQATLPGCRGSRVRTLCLLASFTLAHPHCRGKQDKPGLPPGRGRGRTGADGVVKGAAAMLLCTRCDLQRHFINHKVSWPGDMQTSPGVFWP